MLMFLPMATQAMRMPRRGTQRWVRKWTPFLWVLPACLFYVVFKLLPLISGIYLSLLRWDGIQPAVFVGFQNYQRMLEDDVIALALKNNTIYALGTVAGKIVLSLFLALLLNQSLRG